MRVAHAFGMSVVDMRAVTVAEYTAMLSVLTRIADERRSH